MTARVSSPPGASRLRAAEFGGISLVEGIHHAGSALPWHSHAGPTFCFVLRGAFAEYSRGQTIDCRPSSLKLTPAGADHWNRFDLGDVRGLQIEIDPARCTAVERYGRVLDQHRHFGIGAEQLLVRRMYSEFRTMDTAAPLAIEGLLLELIALIARSRRTGPAGGSAPDWVRRAHDLLHESLATRLSLSGIAAEVGVHPATLARGYRRAYGCSLGEMQRRLRLELAARLLTATELSAVEIAQITGFFDQSHLTNAFRRRFGLSPLRYRRALGEITRR
jgi:AraC-like DNA-binding protein